MCIVEVCDDMGQPIHGHICQNIPEAKRMATVLRSLCPEGQSVRVCKLIDWSAAK